jgi:hypothetical protein
MLQIVMLQVKINVVDVNDNKPVFIFPDSSIRKDKYIGAISREAEVFTSIFQVMVSNLFYCLLFKN